MKVIDEMRAKVLEKFPREVLGVKKHKLAMLLASLPIPFILAVVLFALGQSSTTIIAVFSLGLVLVFVPYFAFEFIEFSEIGKAEEGFPAFLRDMSQSVSSGMSLPSAIATCTQTKYGVLSKHVNKLNVWLSWGIPFPEAWQKFTDSLQKSELISRVNGIVLESFIAGGDIGVVMNSLASDVNLLKRLEAEKKSVMRQQIVIMYIVFFIFIGIIIGLYKILVPILYVQKVGVFGGIALRPAEDIGIEYFKNLFFLMTVVQSACIGLIAGQIAEEKLVGGFKHIIVMIAIGAFAFFTFIYPAQLTMDVAVFPTNPSLGQNVMVSGSLSFESGPATSARVEILSPSKDIITVFTDAAGDFDAVIEAPMQPGTYVIFITASYEGDTVSESQTIAVGG